MENINEALQELDQIIDDACDGKLTEAMCSQRLDAFKAKYGDTLIHGKPLGDIQNEPASKEKLQKLRILRAQGGTSEETFLEMARTGRKLRQRAMACLAGAIAAAAAVIAVIAAIVSAFRH